MQQHLTRIEQANMIAGHAVSYATAYLDGRHTAQQLAENAERLLRDIFMVNSLETHAILVPVRMLADAMKQAAQQGIANTDQEYLEGWQRIVGALVELVIKRSRRIARDQA